MRTKKPLDLSSTLRQVRDPIIEVECRACGHSGSYVRAELVKKHGASVTFARLRRMSALGCDRLLGVDGDKCGTAFPCLSGADR
ncbi:hypothetical protein DB728_20340 [Rhizobium leguminosarum bv. viciae USDA 2370]|uniref:hypothetical protein n=1 Tax=Rhizobium leguminosarum TaxID=384 RepID=UPI00098E9225|nr:hypothetical protein [Rhizobium leguminosarum]MBB5256844.1 hypothetical protein [Rhizobium leguminosarum]MBY5477108.1 hypothetical protein [Rhizobium leguminosarum]OOO47170.1 hypothetical protein BS629_16180 [Rhizobium leguminosarum bv. viciae USDA 2370]PUB63986.1 hypothetical protein DB728_20340 [Rhizobium leguminosarum bv. viciae USDA 2370]